MSCGVKTIVYNQKTGCQSPGQKDKAYSMKKIKVFQLGSSSSPSALRLSEEGACCIVLSIQHEQDVKAFDRLRLPDLVSKL